ANNKLPCNIEISPTPSKMSLVNRPNNVIANQRYFQAPSNTLLFLRGPRDKFFAYTTFLVLGTGVLGSLWGAVKMAKVRLTLYIIASTHLRISLHN
ncbi:hypothetical protein INT43_007252, partial [Umbelopsis isabellina]